MLLFPVISIWKRATMMMLLCRCFVSKKSLGIGRNLVHSVDRASREGTLDILFNLAMAE